MPRRYRDVTKRDREVRRQIGAAIRQVREDRDRSVAWLAEQVEVSDATMSRIECGEQVITTDLLDRIAIALDTTVMSFYRRPEPGRAAHR